MNVRGLAGLFLLVALRASAQQQPVVLTWDRALERARQASPAVIAARLQIEEARARVAGAQLPFSNNPTLDVDAGRRSGATSSTDYALAIEQSIDLPQRRRARIDAANAAVSREEQRALDVEREALRDVAIAFLRALESRERVDAASNARQLASDALLIAERRFAAGDVAQLDVNLARTAVARADADVRSANARLTGDLAVLQVLLDVGEVRVEGSLRDALFANDELRAHATERADVRADVRALDAEIAEAEAEQRFAQTLRRPDLGVRLSFANEERDHIVMGGVALTLPFFQRGQEATALANARTARLRAQRDALRRAIDADVRGAIAKHDALRASAAEYERTVLPLIEENEKLALESYDVGQIGLGELLLVRREALDARRTLIDQLIETRLAEVELHARAGVWK